MPHALIESGVVVQLDLTGNPPQGYVECPDEVQPGYIYDGQIWTMPEPVVDIDGKIRNAPDTLFGGPQLKEVFNGNW